MRGMTGRNSVLGEAMADFEGRKEFSRLFYKIFNPNYGNSQGERDIKYDSKGRVGQFVMDVLVDKEADPENTVRGAYPATVAIIQREKILDDSGKTYNFSEEQKNVTFRFLDSNEGSFFFPDTSFTQDVSAINNLSNKKSFRVFDTGILASRALPRATFRRCPASQLQGRRLQCAARLVSGLLLHRALHLGPCRCARASGPRLWLLRCCICRALVSWWCCLSSCLRRSFYHGPHRNSRHHPFSS